MPVPDQDLHTIVVGAGLVGLGVAWQLVQRGHRVTVLERGTVGEGASWAAAGMLAPSAEIGFEELALYSLGRESLRRWPSFAERLEQASNSQVGYDDNGTLVVATDRDSAERLRRLHRFQKTHRVPVEWLDGSKAAEIEPLLSPRVPAALYAPQDHQVDARAVLRALETVVEKEATLRRYTPVQSVSRGEAPTAVLDDGTRLQADAVVLATGAWTSSIEVACTLPIRPVKGQALAVTMSSALQLRHVVRGPDAYLVPKPDGRLVIGATTEEMGFDTRVTAGGIYRLLEGAVEMVPGVEELPIEDMWAGLRPASRDGAPLLGTAGPGVWVATGHYRHGVLLLPVTSEEIARDVDRALRGQTETSTWIDPFSPHRSAPPHESIDLAELER